MNIAELSSFSSRDHNRFRDSLNSLVWNSSEHVKSSIRERLVDLAESYAVNAGVLKESIRDIVLAGAQASYAYAPDSDIDVFIRVDLSEFTPVCRELISEQARTFTKRPRLDKSSVNFYVTDINNSLGSTGAYSLVNESWIQVPRRVACEAMDSAVQDKFADLVAQIQNAVRGNDTRGVVSILKKLAKLQAISENYYTKFGAEKLVYEKITESAVYATLLQREREIIAESRRARRAEYEFDTTYGYSSEISEDVGSSPDGVAATTRMFLSETDPVDPAEIVRDFVAFCRDRLGMKNETTLRVKRDPAWPGRNKTFGHYNPNNNELTIALTGRHIMDILRTTAHELVHQRQFEMQDMPENAGETGSEWENEANAGAGILMRDYARLHPEFFEIAPVVGTEELDESASGYIPTKKEAKDPRYTMALTVDIKPGALGKNANKLKLNTDSQGRPQVANPNGTFEAMMEEWERFKNVRQ